ncbi:helix-turn-helix transcriptional regulator [Chitinophaga sp. Mgbs1]|uniref:Helix-turn-helix transcriptional regulator n=1 Tax=Chitinophaga solisilvae TaxID=1233460 RepID=A0A3S1JJE9_9BACT|nr:helix-turn-helix transcriptional regulator [Chitinophaga solisilvae]
MLLKFPKDQDDQQILKAGATHFAMLKQRNRVSKRTVFLKENTLIFVIHGYKLLHFDDTTVKVEAGSLLMLKRGFYVMSDNVPDGLQFRSLLLYFSDEQLRRFLHKSGYTEPAQATAGHHLTVPLTPLLESFRNQYTDYFAHMQQLPPEVLALKLYELFLLLTATPQKQQVLAFLQSIVRAQPADIAYIVRAHLFQPLSLAELAKLSGRSLASFKRDFQQLFQTSPKKWINEQRLAHAHTLLRTTPAQVAEIAMECGFENVPHFIHIFRQRYGITPNSIRTKNAII